MRFGEFLISQNYISATHLEDAIATQRFRPKKIGRVLRELGVIDDRTLNNQLKEFLKPELLHSISTAHKSALKTAAKSEISRWALENGSILLEDGNDLKFIHTHFNDSLLEDAELRWKKPAQIILVDHDGFSFLKRAFTQKNDSALFIKIDQPLTDDEKIAISDPYTSLFRDIIMHARTSQASDIHLQPTQDGLDIRLRIHGDLITWKTLSCEHRQSFINEVKRLTNLSIAISGKPQDGRISYKAWRLDIRTSLLPSQYGEKVVLRLLDLTRDFSFDALQFDSETLSELSSVLKLKNGIVIISGPTGSGKTTTLYTLLSSLDRKTKNIVTLEDPIEYGIKGLTQVQVSAKLSFADSLRSVLRQDPDVILVGEIRDSETADLCIKAALTGHLVLTTLHANGAPEVIGRLLNLGVDRFTLASCLRFSAAQRLMRKLCDHCALAASDSTKITLLEKLIEHKMLLPQGLHVKVRNPEGCSQCSLGVIGRIPILEYMKILEIKKYLENPELNKPKLNQSLQVVALKLIEKGGMDVTEVLEMD